MKISHLSRIYTTSLISENHTILIENEDFHYLSSVIRLRKHDKFRLFNSVDGEFIAQVKQLNRSSIIVQIEEKIREIVKDKKLILALAIIKHDRIIEAIKAAVQIGVTEIIPIISERTQYKKIAHPKLEKVIINSVEQSERLMLPSLLPEITLEDFCKMKRITQIIFACESAVEENKISCIKIDETPALLIGPEGGFSDNEIDMVKNYKHVYAVSLGSNVLRSETAAIVGLGCIQMIR